MEELPVFLCYRQDDGTQMAEWLYKRLNDQPISPKDADSPKLKVYFDQTSAAISDWKKLHKPALQRAKAMLVVCTPCLTESREPPDWVHKELGWWVRKRKTAPIPIERSRHDQPCLPEYVRNRWSDCQRVFFDLNEWETLEGTRQLDKEHALIGRIREGILLSQTGIVFEDLQRFKRRSWALAASLLLALMFLGGAGYQWNRASNARDAEQKRSAELEVVTDFQGSMLNNIDPEEMGRALFADLRSGVRESLEAEDVSPEDIESALDTFNQTLLRANATDAARTLIDEQVLSRAVRAIERDFADQPLVRAALQQTVADTYRWIGLFDRALPLQNTALVTRREVLGEEHLSTLESKNRLANLYADRGLYDKAETLYLEVLEIQQRVYAEGHPETLSAQNNLAVLYADQGRYDEAETLYVETLEIQERVRGDEHPGTADSMNNLAILYSRQGRYAEAETLQVKALEIRKRAKGEEHPHTLGSMNNLAILYSHRGRHDKAEPLYTLALEISKRVLGERHPETLNTMNNLAILYKNYGRRDEAEPLYIKTLEIRKLVLGEEHPDTLGAMNNLAVLYLEQGRFDQAEPLRTTMLEIQKRVLGEVHPNTLGSIHNLAILYSNQGRDDEAERLFVRTLEFRKRVLGEEHPNTLDSMYSLALLYWRQGRSDEAEPLHVKTLEIRVRVLGEEHPSTIRTMNNLAILYGNLGRLDDARPLVRALQEVTRRRVGRPGASAVEKNDLAMILLTCKPADLRDPDTALGLARDACAMTDNTNPGHLDTLALAQHLTGDTLAAIETEKKALSLLPPDARERGGCEAALARFEAALKEADTADEPGGG